MESKAITQEQELEAGDEFTVYVSYTRNNLIEFVGEAIPGISPNQVGWRIKRYVYNAFNLKERVIWAEGSTSFDKVWRDRHNYRYS